MCAIKASKFFHPIKSLQIALYLIKVYSNNLFKKYIHTKIVFFSDENEEVDSVDQIFTRNAEDLLGDDPSFYDETTVLHPENDNDNFENFMYQ